MPATRGGGGGGGVSGVSVFIFWGAKGGGGADLHGAKRAVSQ